MRKPLFVLLLAPLLVLATNGCATYEQELQRADEHFSHDEYESTLATLRALEPDWPVLDSRNRARYCYLRGMTDYRIGFKADARHWLAIAAKLDDDTPGSLNQNDKGLVTEKLAELNKVVWAGDVLPTEERPGAKPKKVEPADDTPKGDDDGKKGEEPKPKKKTVE